jgi:hypothetical protein
MKFPRTNAVFVARKHPDRREPFVQTDWRLLKNRADFDRELLGARFALPEAAAAEVIVVLAFAALTYWAFRPPGFGKVLDVNIRVRKEPNRLK